MGLLDALFSGDSGGGLLGGLPSSWQWQNPEEQKKKADFLAAIQQDPLTGAFGGTFTNPPPSSPFPDYKPPAPPTIFDQRSIPASALGGPQPGPVAGSFIPPSSPQPPPLPPAQTIAPAPQPAAQPAPVPDNGPVNMMNVGGYQMPQFGKMADYTPQAPAIPPKVANANAQDTPEAAGPLPPALGGNTLGGNLGASLQSFANTPGGLLPKILGGAGALLTGQRSDPLGIQQQNLKAQYDSLVPLLGKDKALLAVMNPEAGKTLLSEALTNHVDYGVTGEDALGNKTYGWIDKLNQTINGKPIGEDGSSGATSGGNFSFLAPGVKQVDSSLTGNDYLKQYSPEVQSAVKDYIEGRSMPTGNPRKGFTQAVKMIAQKYGSDIGVPADDAAFAERRKMRNDLAASSNSSMGGILSNGKSAFEHLKTYSDKLVDVGNVNVGGPGGGIAANLYNGVTNYGGSSQQRGKVAAATEAGLKYGQESTKFYSGSGGGAEERLAALRANDANSKSGAEQAGFLQAERDLMIGRLQEKEKQIRDVLGQDYLDKHPVMTPELQKTIATIDANISKLRGDAPQSSGGIPAGWTVKVH